MTEDDVRQIAFALPEVVEGIHHGHPDFRVGKSVFSGMMPDKGTVSFRLPEILADDLLAEKPDERRVVGRSKGTAWLIVPMETTAEREVRAMFEAAVSYSTGR